MSIIRFYHMEQTSLDHNLPNLIIKALENNYRILVRAKDEKTAEHINDHLWTYDPNSFLPHGSENDPDSAGQPIFITTKDENPNNANLLILTQGTESKNIEKFDMVCDMIDGRNKEAIEQARNRWKTYKDDGHEVTYWQQSSQGRWEEKTA